MLKYYFKIAWRNLLRHKRFSLINIAGLTIGIATCLVILLFVQYELSYDRFHKNADRIVRVFFRGTVQGERMNESTVMPPVAQVLKADYPEVEAATRLRVAGAPQVIVGDKSFRDDAFAFVDPNFFAVFTLPFIKGDPATALLEPNSLVISEKVAKKYFGQEQPIGRVIQFKDRGVVCKVTGVMADIPLNSQFRFELLGSMASFPEAREPNWMVSEFYTYLLLQKGADYKKLEAKLPQTIEKYLGPQLQQSMGLTYAEFQAKGNQLGLLLQPLTDIYLHSDFNYDLSAHGDIRYVWIFSAIALFMLLIACINFMNLSTAGASKRLKEVGVRKVVGSGKGALIGQFLIESILLTTISLVLAVALVEITLPLFKNWSDTPLNLGWTTSYWLLPGLLIFGLATGVLAGSYPAFFLSALKPGAMLKSGSSPKGLGSKSTGLRNGLVVFQFFLSIALMVCTAVVYQQLRFAQQTELGYDKSAVLILPDLQVLGEQAGNYLAQLRHDPRVLHVSSSDYLPAGASHNNNFFLYSNGNENQWVKTLRYEVDEQYLPTLGIRTLGGRNFSKEFPGDSSAILVNEAAAKAFGFENNTSGQTLTTHLKNGDNKKTYQVIGVLQDFHFRSLHERISPLVMVLGNNYGSAILKIKMQDSPALLASLKARWTALTDEPFAYSFLDERVRDSYQSEQRFGLLLLFFTALTIFVACLGLFGLAIFIAEQRTKEIGVRKVLGASVVGIVGLLSKDFLKLVLIALLLAAPVAYFFMEKWLSDFAYRIDIQWWVFALAGLLAAGIAFLTVGFQSVKAALANPVESLRSE